MLKTLQGYFQVKALELVMTMYKYINALTLLPLRTTVFQKSVCSPRRTPRGRRWSSETHLKMPGFLASPSKPTPSSSTRGCELDGVHSSQFYFSSQSWLWFCFFFATQMAGLRPSFLPGCPTCPGGRGLHQPWSLGSGQALRGLSAPTQNSKWGCRSKACWINVGYELIHLRFFCYLKGEPRVENPTEPMVKKYLYF